MFLLFPEMGKIIASNVNLDVSEIQDGIDHPNDYNKWEKIDNADGSFYLSFPVEVDDEDVEVDDEDVEKTVPYYLRNCGKDYLGACKEAKNKFIYKDDTIVHFMEGKASNFTLNIKYDYLSDRNVSDFIQSDKKSTVIKLVDKLP